jgi:archaellum component FlaF (FlaF/FlaG flagellin family)
MGFSVSATMAIFFATFLILFSVLYNSVNDTFDSVSESFDDRYEYMSDRTQTDVSVVGVKYSKYTDTLEITVQNTGSVPLGIGNTQLLVGGMVVVPETMEVEGTTTAIWLPQETLTITLSNPNTTFDPAISPRTSLHSDAGLSNPSNISVGESVYVIDGTSIDVLSFDGLLEFTITDGVNLVAPVDLKVHGDYVYVLDEGTHIDRFDTDGSWIDRFIDDPTNLSAPVSIGVDDGYIYIVDGNSHLDRFNRSTGAFVDQLISNGGTMTTPQDVFVSSFIYVIDVASGSYHIDRYSPDGTGGTEVIASTRLSAPTDVAVSASGVDQAYIYVLNNSREVLVFDDDGTYIGTVSESLSSSVSGVDVSGKIFVSDHANGLVVENLGTSIKVVTENGVSEITML